MRGPANAVCRAQRAGPSAVFAKVGGSSRLRSHFTRASDRHAPRYRSGCAPGRYRWSCGKTVPRLARSRAPPPPRHPPWRVGAGARRPRAMRHGRPHSSTRGGRPGTGHTCAADGKHGVSEGSTRPKLNEGTGAERPRHQGAWNNTRKLPLCAMLKLAALRLSTLSSAKTGGAHSGVEPSDEASSVCERGAHSRRPSIASRMAGSRGARAVRRTRLLDETTRTTVRTRALPTVHASWVAIQAPRRPFRGEPSASESSCSPRRGGFTGGLVAIGQ